GDGPDREMRIGMVVVTGAAIGVWARGPAGPHQRQPVIDSLGIVLVCAGCTMMHNVAKAPIGSQARMSRMLRLEQRSRQQRASNYQRQTQGFHRYLSHLNS